MKTMRLPVLVLLLLVLGAGCSCSEESAPPERVFDAAAAWTILTDQVAFGPRNPGSSGHSACLEYLVKALEHSCASVQTQEFIHEFGSQQYQMANVIGVLNPGGGDRIVLGAHWDTRPFADRDPDPANQNTPIPGANDGASGVAVLVQLAAQLSTAQLPYEIVIVLFDGEDFGHAPDEYFLGSTYYAAQLDDSTRPKRAIVVDMVGDADLHLLREVNSLLSDRALVDTIWQKGTELGFPQYAYDSGLYIWDDHIPLIQAGVPSVDVIDLDYPYWHTLADTPDKCSQDSLLAVGEVLYRLIAEGRL
jgi:hypothetical protein